jgi:CheY-like chemotaxis protein
MDHIAFDLRYALDDTMRTLAPRAHQKGLELAWHVASDVPSALAGDPTRLRQIIVNLIGNAVKFTETGEVVLRVECESRDAGQAVLHFTVRDTGIGILAEKQARIFEAFTQADTSTTRRFGGTGLGLTISSQLVGLMKGRIWVESEPGRGSRFHVTLPFETRLESAPTPPSRELADLRGMHVLVVDDNATNRRILEEILANWGMSPTVVDGGEPAFVAMEVAREAGTPFRLVLLDYQMPEMDGFEIAARIKQRPELAEATIMMLSSMGQRGDAVRCKELGVAAYLSKPIRQSVLLDAILAVRSTPASAAGAAPLITRHSLRESHGPYRILLAEDNPVNTHLVKAILEKHGHTVTAVGDGRQAVEAVGRDTFDLILMDVQMPVMDGFEATKAIREDEKRSGLRIPIVALTAHAMKGDEEKCRAAGMDDYLTKPIDRVKLDAALNRLLPNAGSTGSTLAIREQTYSCGAATTLYRLGCGGGVLPLAASSKPTTSFKFPWRIAHCGPNRQQR